jgi:hypothetical protein
MGWCASWLRVPAQVLHHRVVASEAGDRRSDMQSLTRLLHKHRRVAPQAKLRAFRVRGPCAVAAAVGQVRGVVTPLPSCPPTHRLVTAPSLLLRAACVLASTCTFISESACTPGVRTFALCVFSMWVFVCVYGCVRVSVWLCLCLLGVQRHLLYPSCLSTAASCVPSAARPVVTCVRSLNAVEFLHRFGGNSLCGQIEAAVRHGVTDHTALELLRRCYVRVTGDKEGFREGDAPSTGPSGQSYAVERGEHLPFGVGVPSPALSASGGGVFSSAVAPLPLLDATGVPAELVGQLPPGVWTAFLKLCDAARDKHVTSIAATPSAGRGASVADSSHGGAGSDDDSDDSLDLMEQEGAATSRGQCLSVAVSQRRWLRRCQRQA